jgi:hypothetical protein
LHCCKSFSIFYLESHGLGDTNHLNLKPYRFACERVVEVDEGGGFVDAKYET